MRTLIIVWTALLTTLLFAACGSGDDAPAPSSADVVAGDVPGDVAVTGDVSGPGTETVTSCGVQLAGTPGTCTVTPGGEALLLEGDLILPDGVLEGGQVLISAGAIS
ncbi:MAG: hypothetical protein VX938_07930, partial [Myxococcota bacterium]|nr:hypothetical protein [Myxococcota bacterium]